MELDTVQVATLLSLAESEVRNLARSGKLPHLDLEGPLRFNRQAILEWALSRGHPLAFALDEVEPTGLPPLRDLFIPKHFYYDMPGDTFAEVLRAGLDAFQLPPEADKELLYDLLVSREKLMTTALGEGLALPHLRVPLVVNVPEPTLGIFFTHKPIGMGALDGKPVHTLFLLLTLGPKQHLELLARLAFLFRSPDFVRLLRDRAKPATVIEFVNETAMGGKSSK
jgi:PTS system nitrogen regulatory IIA component